MTRRLAVWILLLIVFVALVATAASAGGDGSGALAAPIERDGVAYAGTLVQDGDGTARVATIPVYNSITDGDSAADGSSTGGDDLVRMIDAIIDDEDGWDGVILELDTPGGSVTASEEVADALQRLERETDIPTVAWMRGTAASAGYYLAASTDRIVASPTTFTGSIGVILEYYVVDELADEVGVEQVTIKSGKLKDIGSPFRKVTAEERAVFQRIIDEAYGSFVDVVAEGRGLPEAKVRTLADGRIYTGRQAKANGLVDELGLRRDAYQAIAELIDDDAGDDAGEDLDVVRFSRSYGLLESLSASAQPSLEGLATARAVGGALSGDGRSLAALARTAAGPGAARAGTGFAHLEYRAQLG